MAWRLSVLLLLLTATRSQAQPVFGTAFDLTAGAVANPVAGPPDVTAGLVARWTLDESNGVTVADSSGNNNTGYMTGTVAHVAGRVGWGLGFTAANSAYINVVDSASLQTVGNAGTLAYWMYLTPPAATMGFCGKANFMSGTSTNAFGAGTTTSTLYGIMVGDGTSQTTTSLPGGVAQFPANWVYCVGGWDIAGATTRGFWTNGVLAASVTSGGKAAVVPAGTPFRIGCGAAAGAPPATPANFATVWLDDVRLYNRFLTTAEITQLYQYQTQSAFDLVTGLVAFWRMDEASGTGCGDSSGVGNTLTVDTGTPMGTAGHLNNCFNTAGISAATNLMTKGLPAWSTNGYSLSFWVKMSPSQTCTIYGESSTTDSNPLLQFKGTTGGAGTNLAVSLRVTGGATPLNVTGSAKIADNTWHYVAWTDQNGTAKMYVDNVLDPVSFNYTPAPNSFNATTVAGFMFSGAPAGKGTISLDEFRVYTNVLTTAKIAALYGL